MQILRLPLLSPLLSLLSLALAAGACAPAWADTGAQPVKLLRDRAPDARPQIMFIASAHLANHGKDVVNTDVPDILEPQRQTEITALAEALVRFRPTKVAVEMKMAQQAQLDARYEGYRKGSYRLSREESDQLGMRVAAGLGHARMYAVDWNEMPPGPISNYDYQEFAANHGQQARFDAMRSQARVKDENALLRREPVSAWYLHFNDPRQLEKKNRAYFDYAMFNDGKDYPGANWVGAWYGRNLKIFANLVQLADSPQDRVLVIYGQGHVFPLRQYAEQSGAFTVVDPLPFIRATKP